MPKSSQEVAITFRGQELRPYFDESLTCAALIEALQQAVGQPLAPQTLKLIIPKHGALRLSQTPDRILHSTGVKPGSKLLLMGSYASELDALQESSQAASRLRLPDFDHEAARTAQRSQRPANATLGPHFFGSFQVLPLPPGAPPSAPAPSAALSLLHKVAADPAIVAVMAAHDWQVGLLSEMPPEGKVGISAVCILGYNVNRGQEISLRLRTDDWRGFRKYLRIRETLVHELAHMVFDEHDANFKQLNSELLKEVAAHEAAAAAGTRTLVDTGVFGGDWLGENAADSAAAPVPAQGRRLGGDRPIERTAHGVRQSAAAAALVRWQQQQQQQQECQQLQQQQMTRDTGPFARLPVPAEPAEPAAPPADAAATEGHTQRHAWQQQQAEAILTAASQGSVVSSDALDNVLMAEAGGGASASQAMQDFKDQEQCDSADVPAGATAEGLATEGNNLSDNPSTAAAEEAMRRLGSMDDDKQQALSQQQPPTREQYHQQQQEGQHQQQQKQQRPALQQPCQQTGRKQCQLLQDGYQHQKHESGPEVGTGQYYAAITAAANGDAHGVVVQKLTQVQAELQHLLLQAGSGNSTRSSLSQQLQAVQDLAGVLRNLVANPREPKFRRLRCSNAAFQRKLGHYPAAIVLLKLAGFVERQQVWQVPGQRTVYTPQADSCAPEPVLLYVRDEPGLLWLVLSAVQDMEEQLQQLNNTAGIESAA